MCITPSSVSRVEETPIHLLVYIDIDIDIDR